MSFLQPKKYLPAISNSGQTDISSPCKRKVVWCKFVPVRS